MADLTDLREKYVAAWSRYTTLSDWAVVANTATAAYVPALEAEVERLRAIKEAALDAVLAWQSPLADGRVKAMTMARLAEKLDVSNGRRDG